MGIIAAFIIALLLSLLFSPGYGKGGSVWPLTTFFTVLFLAALAGHLWIIPFGPVMFGVAWMPLFFVGMICAFLLATPPPQTKAKSTSIKSEEAISTLVLINTFIWILLLILFTVIIIGYYK